MNDNFISKKESEPELFALCDIQVNDSIYTECRYLKYDDGTSVWVNKWCQIPSQHVSCWRLNPKHSDELTKEWMDSEFKPMIQYPNFNKEDWPTITIHT